jgi:RNA polymerase sigma factor (sigma-70 family)
MAVGPIRGGGDPQRRVVGERTGELFERHARMVYGLCRALLRDPTDADDATQATFVSAYKSLLGGNAVREPAAWLATIARNECASRAHARMREPLPLLDGDLGHAPGPEAELDRRAVVEELRHAIGELPDRQREAVVLRDLYGLPYTEVSAALGISVPSVESLLFRARRSLRVSLKPLATGTLVVPVAVRESIALALPGFPSGGAAGSGVVSGAIGAGLLAKLAGGPAAVKIAAGVAAVAVTGSAAVVGAEQAGRERPRAMRADNPALVVRAGFPSPRTPEPSEGHPVPTGEGAGARDAQTRYTGGRDTPGGDTHEPIGGSTVVVSDDEEPERRSAPGSHRDEGSSGGNAEGEHSDVEGHRPAESDRPGAVDSRQDHPESPERASRESDRGAEPGDDRRSQDDGEVLRDTGLYGSGSSEERDGPASQVTSDEDASDGSDESSDDDSAETMPPPA